MNFAPNTSPEEKVSFAAAMIINLINELSKKEENMSASCLAYFSTIKSGFYYIHKYIQTRLSLFGENIELSLPIYERIFNMFIMLKEDIIKNTNSFEERSLDDSHYFELFVSDEVFMIPYRKRSILNNYEFEIIYRELLDKNLDIGNIIDINIFNNIETSNKNTLSETIINLKNVYSQSFTLPDKGINKYQIYLDTLKSIQDLNQLKSQINEIKDSHDLLEKVKTNTAIENTYELNNGYKEIAKKLRKNINLLNRIIILLFIAIVSIITIKLIFITLFQVFFENALNFLTYISLILSITALITYLIKERNRIIKIHDYFNLTHLELNTLPKYMRELDSKQRQDLVIQLSSNFFRSSTTFTPNINSSTDISGTNNQKLLIETIVNLLEKTKK